MKNKIRKLTLSGLVFTTIVACCNGDKQINYGYIESESLYKDTKTFNKEKDKSFIFSEHQIKAPIYIAEKFNEFYRNFKYPDPRRDYIGFELEEIENKNFPISYHRLFINSERDFIVQYGAMSYLISREGQLLTHGSHALLKQNKLIFASTGSNVYFESTPRDFSEFDDEEIDDKNDWLIREFDEKDTGIFAKNWSF